ncbi:MAG: hypothetical protein IPH63_05635 [Flavobacteriales bacterium]|nr:hypothetical protein [Flavobacteriales bacterium]
MKRNSFIPIALLTATFAIVLFVSFRQARSTAQEPMCHVPAADPELAAQHVQPPAKGCVFKTIYEGEGLDSSFVLATPGPVLLSEERGLAWLVKAQANNGGFGSGTHARQDIIDPHAVSADPATTSMVGMALLRMGNTLENGEHSATLKKATEYLLGQVEGSPKGAMNITALQGTQIQSKLGANIDVALTAQYLSNLVAKLGEQHPMKLRCMRALNTCVAMIQRSQQSDGSVQGDGWAGVLQSSFAANALESAKAQGAEVDDESLDLARDYQKANFDVGTGGVATDRAAGVTLYAVSGSSRSSAMEAREVSEVVVQARKSGKVKKDAPVSVETLEEVGYTRSEAEKLNTAYNVYNSAKQQAQDERVISGFGNNGGEEFLSFLQTGEALVIGKDDGWKNWYQQTTGRLVSIQNQDGSWNGHHCITSPVFCTATSLLILSVNNDIEHLLAQGAVKYRN